MRPPSILWPFPWWTAAVVALLLVLVPWTVAQLRVIRRNRRLHGLGLQLRVSGMALASDSFSTGEGKNVLVVEGERLAMVDLKTWRIVQLLSWAETNGLKIYDNRSNLIEFRLVMNGDAQTRKLATRSIAGFGRLFVLFGRAGKPVEYIQS